MIEVTTNFGAHFWSFVNRGTCKKCGEDVLWVETHNGKMCPVDLEPDEEYVFTSHFNTCSTRIREEEEKKNKPMEEPPWRKDGWVDPNPPKGNWLKPWDGEEEVPF